MRVIALENGEVDYSPVDATNIYRFFDVEKEEAKDGYTVLYRFGNHNRELMYNNDNGVTSGINSVFNNQKLRQAFSTAIDCYQAAIGFGNTETSFVLVNDTGMPGAQDWLDKWYEESWYEYDVDEALRLLQESGHSKDEGLTVRLLTNGATVNLAGCAVYQAFWADIGVTTDILGYDQALFNTYKFNSAEWDLINDVKPNGFGICPIGWNDIFDPTAYENGGACFTHDDHLVELLKAANMIHDEASVDAFHQYQMTMNYEYPISCSYSYYVAQDGITGIWLTCNAYKNFPVWGSFTYADDYKSVA
jgi:ABC-type transport system substrate-binding protein